MTNTNETQVAVVVETQEDLKAKLFKDFRLSKNLIRWAFIVSFVNLCLLLTAVYLNGDPSRHSMVVSQLRADLISLEKQVASYQSRVEPIIKQVEESEKNKLSNVQAQLQLATLFIHLKSLVNLAIVKLNADHDTVNTLIILNTVQETIKSQNLLDLTNLRKLVMLKMEQITQINQPDVDNLQALLQEYTNLVEHLSLKDFLITNQTKITVDRTTYSQDFTTKIQEASYWKKVFTDIQNNLRSLITIRNIKDSENSFKRLLTQEQIDMLKTYLKLKAAEISLNILERNQVLYAKNMADIEHNIQLYFVNDSSAKPKLLNILSKLKATDLSMPFVDLQEISKEINNLSNFAPL